MTPKNQLPIDLFPITADDPEVKITFKTSTSMRDVLEQAAKRFDMSMSGIIRASVRDWLMLYLPEAIDPSISVVEPSDVSKRRMGSR